MFSFFQPPRLSSTVPVIAVTLISNLVPIVDAADNVWSVCYHGMSQHKNFLARLSCTYMRGRNIHLMFNALMNCNNTFINNCSAHYPYQEIYGDNGFGNYTCILTQNISLSTECTAAAIRNNSPDLSNKQGSGYRLLFGFVGSLIGGLTLTTGIAYYRSHRSYENFLEPQRHTQSNENNSVDSLININETRLLTLEKKLWNLEIKIEQAKEFDGEVVEKFLFLKQKINSLKDNYNCSITLEIPAQPFTPENCDHIFEETAIKEWIGKNKNDNNECSCPVCRTLFKKIKLNENAASEINETITEIETQLSLLEKSIQTLSNPLESEILEIEDQGAELPKSENELLEEISSPRLRR